MQIQRIHEESKKVGTVIQKTRRALGGKKKATREKPADWRSLEVGEEGKWKGIISDQKRTGTASFGLLRRDFGRAWGWRVEPSTKVTVGTRKINY